MDGWQFDSRIAVTPEPARSTYHHLDGAGRRHIAVSGGMVAVTWEDDRSGDPQVYAAILSADGEAFEGGSAEDYPLVLGSNSFIPGFEEQLVGAKGGEEKTETEDQAAT